MEVQMRKNRFITLCICTAVTIAIIVHFWRSQESFCYRLPISFSTSNIPVTEVTIQNHTHPLAIDLGSKTVLSLRREILAPLDKELVGPVSWRDVKGHTYESVSYHLPKITIGELSLENVLVEQECDEFIVDSVIYNPNNRTPVELVDGKYGSIGLPLLEKTNLLLDCPNAVAYVTNDPGLLKKYGYVLADMIRIPIETGPKGCFVEVETDFGLLRLGIDTGTSRTIIRRQLVPNDARATDWRGMPYCNNTKFIMGGEDFEQAQLVLLDLNHEDSFHGLLGMDFLKQHAVYIDYQNKLLYIKK